jgi:hypothetical protein
LTLSINFDSSLGKWDCKIGMLDYTIKACRGRLHALEDLSKFIVDKWSWFSFPPSILLGKMCEQK